MSITTLSAHKFRKVLYSAPRRKRLDIEIDANRAIDIYTVPVSEFARWRSDKEFSGSSFLRRKNLRIAFTSGPEFEEDWYLVLENISDDPIEVEYDVFER